MATLWKVEDRAERVLGARRAFRECVAEVTAAADSDVDAAELIYGELVANTLRHARGAVEARLEADDAQPLVLVVRDHGPGIGTQPPSPQGDPYAESGRGLAIVELLAREIDVDHAADGGTIVRATLPVTPRTSID